MSLSLFRCRLPNGGVRYAPRFFFLRICSQLKIRKCCFIVDHIWHDGQRTVYNAKQLRLGKNLTVFLNVLLRQRCEIILAETDDHKVAHYEVVQFSVLIPQATIEWELIYFPGLITDNCNRVNAAGVSCLYVTADLMLQGTQTRSYFFWVWRLTRLYHEHGYFVVIHLLLLKLQQPVKYTDCWI